MRVAPNQNFKYVDPKLLKLYLKLRSPRSLPSMLLPMACQEFVQRMQKDCNLPNLVYKQAEFYYMQASFLKLAASAPCMLARPGKAAQLFETWGCLPQGPTRLSTAMRAEMRLTEPPFSTVLDPGGQHLHMDMPGRPRSGQPPAVVMGWGMLGCMLSHSDQPPAGCRSARAASEPHSGPPPLGQP